MSIHTASIVLKSGELVPVMDWLQFIMGDPNLIWREYERGKYAARAFLDDVVRDKKDKLTDWNYGNERKVSTPSGVLLPSIGPLFRTVVSYDEPTDMYSFRLLEETDVQNWDEVGKMVAGINQSYNELPT